MIREIIRGSTDDGVRLLSDSNSSDDGNKSGDGTEADAEAIDGVVPANGALAPAPVRRARPRRRKSGPNDRIELSETLEEQTRRKKAFDIGRKRYTEALEAVEAGRQRKRQALLDSYRARASGRLEGHTNGNTAAPTDNEAPGGGGPAPSPGGASPQLGQEGQTPVSRNGDVSPGPPEAASAASAASGVSGRSPNQWETPVRLLGNARGRAVRESYRNTTFVMHTPASYKCVSPPSTSKPTPTNPSLSTPNSASSSFATPSRPAPVAQLTGSSQIPTVMRGFYVTPEQSLTTYSHLTPPPSYLCAGPRPATSEPLPVTPAASPFNSDSLSRNTPVPHRPEWTRKKRVRRLGLKFMPVEFNGDK